MKFKEYVARLKAANPDVKVQHKINNRRDLLNAGLLGGMSYVLAPTLISMIAREARGQETCDTSGAATLNTIPVLIVNGAGGMNVTGRNIMIGGIGGQAQDLPVDAYAPTGLLAEASPLGTAPPPVNLVGDLQFHQNSGMFTGIANFTSVVDPANDPLAKTNGVSFCARSGDDTNTNQHFPGYWLAKAGIGGEVVALAGTNGDPVTAGNFAAPVTSIDPSVAPTQVRSTQDAANLVVPGVLSTLLGGPVGIDRVLRAAKRMSESKLAAFNQQQASDQLKALMACAYDKANAQMTQFDASDVDASQDQIIADAFSASAAGAGNFNNVNGTLAQSAVITKLLLDGHVGCGVTVVGGCDYHGNGIQNQDTKDQEVGEIIGAALRAAAMKQQNLMIFLITDGATSANTQQAGDATNRIGGTNDSGAHSGVACFAYRAGGTAADRPINITGNAQVGYYNDAGAVADATAISNSPETMTRAMVATWLQAMDRKGDFAGVVGTDPFGDDFDKYAPFAPFING